MCNDILEINVKIAYEIEKSDKLYILKENIEALFKDKEKEFDNNCKKYGWVLSDKFNFKLIVQLFLDV